LFDKQKVAGSIPAISNNLGVVRLVEEAVLKTVGVLKLLGVQFPLHPFLLNYPPISLITISLLKDLLHLPAIK
jgi:hypothetical protein